MRCPLEGFPIYCIYLFIYPFIYPFIYLFISRGSSSALVSTPPAQPRVWQVGFSPIPVAFLRRRKRLKIFSASAPWSS